MRDLRLLPKAHLHLHLDGAMRPSTLAELSRQYRLDVPVIRGYGSFSHFMTTIQAVQAVLRKPGDVERLIREAMEDALGDGAVWVELSMWPGMLRRLGPFAGVTEVVLDAGNRAATDLGVGFGLMLAINRGQGPVEATEIAELAVSLRDRGVVALGLDGDEAAFTAEDFAPAFALAKSAGLLCTPHAGELAGPESVRAVLGVLHADRILHGVSAIDDASLVAQLRDEGVCLDVCPTSNVMLAAVPSIESHPLPALLRQGVRCSVNADDPGLFGTTLLQEYELCRSTLALSDEELANIARTSVGASGAPVELKKAARTQIQTWLAQP